VSGVSGFKSCDSGVFPQNSIHGFRLKMTPEWPLVRLLTSLRWRDRAKQRTCHVIAVLGGFEIFFNPLGRLRI
jgi:hypothetical protein